MKRDRSVQDFRSLFEIVNICTPFSPPPLIEGRKHFSNQDGIACALFRWYAKLHGGQIERTNERTNERTRVEKVVEKFQSFVLTRLIDSRGNGQTGAVF